jgi:hypothetical protein
MSSCLCQCVCAPSITLIFELINVENHIAQSVQLSVTENGASMNDILLEKMN